MSQSPRSMADSLGKKKRKNRANNKFRESASVRTPIKVLWLRAVPCEAAPCLFLCVSVPEHATGNLRCWHFSNRLTLPRRSSRRGAARPMRMVPMQQRWCGTRRLRRNRTRLVCTSGMPRQQLLPLHQGGRRVGKRQRVGHPPSRQSSGQGWAWLAYKGRAWLRSSLTTLTRTRGCLSSNQSAPPTEASGSPNPARGCRYQPIETAWNIQTSSTSSRRCRRPPSTPHPIPPHPLRQHA